MTGPAGGEERAGAAGERGPRPPSGMGPLCTSSSGDPYRGPRRPQAPPAPCVVFSWGLGSRPRARLRQEAWAASQVL